MVNGAGYFYNTFQDPTLDFHLDDSPPSREAFRKETDTILMSAKLWIPDVWVQCTMGLK